MFERFTSDARNVVTGAVEAATQRGDRTIGTQHLLLAITQRDDRLSAVLARHGITTAAITSAAPAETHEIDEDALRSVGIDVDEIRRRTEDAFGAGALDVDRTERSRRRASPLGRHIPFGKDAKQALENSLRAAVNRGDKEITAAHLALGVLSGSAGKGGRLMASRANGELRADLIAVIGVPPEADDGGDTTYGVGTG